MDSKLLGCVSWELVTKVTLPTEQGPESRAPKERSQGEGPAHLHAQAQYLVAEEARVQHRGLRPRKWEKETGDVSPVWLAICVHAAHTYRARLDKTPSRGCTGQTRPMHRIALFV